METCPTNLMFSAVILKNLRKPALTGAGFLVDLFGLSRNVNGLKYIHLPNWKPSNLKAGLCSLNVFN